MKTIEKLLTVAKTGVVVIGLTVLPATAGPLDGELQAARSDVFEAPRSDVFEAPRSDVFEAPRSDVFEAPRSDVFEAPRG